MVGLVHEGWTVKQALAFASNFLWVMVIGLLGPSLPAIVEDLGISYAQAGLFFMLLSLGSLFVASLGVPIPPAGVPQKRAKALAILANRRVLATSVMIFFSVAIDLEFVYWLAEYFAAELGVSLRLSSSAVGVYLVGVISGRITMPLALKRLRPEALLLPPEQDARRSLGTPGFTFSMRGVALNRGGGRA